MPNRLIHETSPYLLQHAHNPVDWYPWGEEALTRARTEDKPILISIGYAACHWCHVMEHESFEDEEVAAYMNAKFINIKVDREERPDLDAIYMGAVQALTGQGGWPMNVFLTPQLEPFYGGTYFPPHPRQGLTSWQQVVVGLGSAWRENRASLLENAKQVVDHIQQEVVLGGKAFVLDMMLFERAVEGFDKQFDLSRGGFGGAPKFPPSASIEFLLNLAHVNQNETAQHMAEVTLDNMAWGGMYDHVGGGFARYSTDVRWLAPHFEKMLYDNGQLVRVYLHAYQVTDNPLYRRVVEETLDWTLRELTHADGGFYSSLDADSEGVEGKFYVWSEAEIDALLGEDAPLFKARYDISADGNWEHHNIPNTLRSDLLDVAARFGLPVQTAEQKLNAALKTLYNARARRVWPGLDDKVLTSWNGLMLAAFAEAGRVLKRADYVQAAERNAIFLYKNMRDTKGRLLRTWKAGHKAKFNAYLEDYAYLADGLLALYQTTFEEKWFVWARELADLMLHHFVDEANGGFFDTSDDHEVLLLRPKNVQDNATPSANAMAARVLTLLSLYTGEGHYVDHAEEAVSALYPYLTQYPSAFAHWLSTAWLLLNEPKEVAIVGEVADAIGLIAVVQGEFRPNTILAVGTSSTIPLLANREQLNGQPTAYVCENFTCQLPTTDPRQLNVLME
ncbi:MAG: thioredoxin domain-containing protein [Candidatus Promineifilaceae bacterium]